jgi:Kef-type K+ transport system membrane component KefB
MRDVVYLFVGTIVVAVIIFVPWVVGIMISPEMALKVEGSKPLALWCVGVITIGSVAIVVKVLMMIGKNIKE